MKRMTIYILLLALLTSFTACSGSKKPKKPEIEQVKAICRLATYECHLHGVAKGTKDDGSGIFEILYKKRRFWIEYTGIAKIGIDMEKGNIVLDGNSVTVYLPNAELLSFEIDDAEFNKDTIVCNEDQWLLTNPITAKDQTNVFADAKKEMIENINNNAALLKKAQDRAKSLIENYINQISKISGIKYNIIWIYEGEQGWK